MGSHEGWLDRRFTDREAVQPLYVSPPRRAGRKGLIRRLSIRCAACALSTSALVLGQAPKAPQEKKAAPPPDATALVGQGKRNAELELMRKEMIRKVLVEAAKGAGAEGKVKGTIKEVAKHADPPRNAAFMKAVARQRTIRAANLAPLIQQYTQQGRPMARAEVLFVRAICKLEPAKVKEIAKEAETTLKDVAKNIAEAQHNPQVRVAPGETAKPPDAAKMLHDGLASAFKKHLSPDQWTSYQKESAQRALNRKEAALSFLVDALDRELLLSATQRDKLTRTFSANWDDTWCMYLEYISYGNQFFPQAIDQLVAPVLNDTQRKAWQSTQKVSGFWGFGGMWNNMIEDDFLADLLGEEKQEQLGFGVAAGAVVKKAMVRKAVEAKK
jgi:hypothetical protein